MSLLDRAILVVFFVLAALHVFPLSALSFALLALALLASPLIQK